MTSYLFLDYIFHVHIVHREMLLMMIIQVVVVVVGVEAHCSLPMIAAQNRKLIAMAHNYYLYHHYYNYH